MLGYGLFGNKIIDFRMPIMCRLRWAPAGFVRFSLNLGTGIWYGTSSLPVLGASVCKRVVIGGGRRGRKRSRRWLTLMVGQKIQYLRSTSLNNGSDESNTLSFVTQSIGVVS
jgi:hypothetical protein